ncbi:MAG: hypothetical protein K9G41_09570 [Flavobacteriales bacterium]|nr:hypothetical protein [Flavobacteriales bacterium]
MLLTSTALFCCNNSTVTTEPYSKRAESQLHFKSTFDGNIQITSPTTNKDGKWSQKIIGTDSNTGVKWPSSLPGNNDKSKFIYLIDNEINPSNVVKTAIETTIGQDGKRTQALYQEVKKAVKSQEGKLARNQLNLMNDPEYMFRNIRVAYKLRLQENLESVMPNGSWRQITEIRGTDDSYRIGVYINRSKTGGPLFWKIQAQQGPVWKMHKPDWLETSLHKTNKSNTIEIPVGEWFLIEFHLISDKNGNGQFSCSINDKTLIKHSGKISTNKGFKSWHIFKTYVSQNALNAGAHYQWIDDVEIEINAP